MDEEEKKGRYSTVSLPTPLVEKIKKRIEGTGFTSISSYVTYVLRELLAGMEQDETEAFSKDDEEKIKDRLRALGYLE